MFRQVENCRGEREDGTEGTEGTNGVAGGGFVARAKIRLLLGGVIRPGGCELVL